MNLLLWILQAALALLCVAGGAYKIFSFEELQKAIVSARELPRVLWIMIGAFEMVAGLGLILPAALKLRPGLTPVAATAVAVESVLISVLYLSYRDFPPVAYTAVMAALAAFIAYGRFVLRPF